MLNSLYRKISRATAAVVVVAGLAGLTGCQTSHSNLQPAATESKSAESPAAVSHETAETMVLEPGDTVHISFPGAPSLDTTQTIRRDGKINLETVGEIQAQGLTPHGLEQVLLDKYGPQLVVKEISVTVPTSEFVVYVTGAVERGGKIVADRRLTPLEAVIEAGVDTDKSDLKRVTVIREAPDGKTEKFKLNLKAIMQGKPATPFALQPYDVLFVPERFTWY